MRHWYFTPLLAVVATLSPFVESADAHPSSGIVVDEKGNV